MELLVRKKEFAGKILENRGPDSNGIYTIVIWNSEED